MKNPKLKNIREYIGYVFQNPDYQIFANTVKEEIYYGENNTINESRDLYIDYWLKRFNLSDFLDKSPHTLSYGERRRLNFLSATIKLPQIIIYDEPTVGLDYENRKVLLEFMKYHNDNGKTQILISHDRWFKEHIQGDFERIKL
jgi:energy-coupling factor transport system ATP-binding protein